MRRSGFTYAFCFVVAVATACSGTTIDAGSRADTEVDPPEILANTPAGDADDATSSDSVNAETPNGLNEPVDAQDVTTEPLPPVEGSAAPANQSTGDSDPNETSVVEPTSTPPTTSAPATSAPATSAPPNTPAPTTATTATTATSAPATDASGFAPVGSALPSDADCAARVQAAPEVRAGNVSANARAGGPTLTGPLFGRVTGNMTGTTDEIIQWASCKWGVPADVARAQAATETYWRQGFLGDWTTTAADCAPGHALGADGRADECPQSIGLLQIKYKFFKNAFPGAEQSTAYNVDYAYAVWRNCFEGGEQWLNDSPRGRDYAAGDGWGCIGRWFAGEWYTAPATNYISEVQERLDTRVWNSSDFLNHG